MQRPERAADELDLDRAFLVVLKREQGLGWVAIDELDAENLRLRERSRDTDGKAWLGVGEVFCVNRNLNKQTRSA